MRSSCKHGDRDVDRLGDEGGRRRPPPPPSAGVPKVGPRADRGPSSITMAREKMPRATTTTVAVVVGLTALLAPRLGPASLSVVNAKGVVPVEVGVEGKGKPTPSQGSGAEGLGTLAEGEDELSPADVVAEDDVFVDWPERVELVGATRAQGEYRRVADVSEAVKDTKKGSAKKKVGPPVYALEGQSDAGVQGLTLVFKADTEKDDKGSNQRGRWTVQDAFGKSDGWDRSEVCSHATPPHLAEWRNALGQRTECVKRRKLKALKFPSLPFSDAAFPAAPESLGPSIRTGPVDWVRALELEEAGGGSSFYSVEGPRPCDVHSGDPSLVPHLAALDAMAMVAARADHVRNTLLGESATSDASGRVSVRLYNPVATQILGFDADEWVAEDVSDRVPVVRGTLRPVFAQPRSAVTWPLLVEKALAKREGSYQALGSSHGPLALPYFLTTLAGCREVEVYTNTGRKKKQATYAVSMVTASTSDVEARTTPAKRGEAGPRWAPRAIPFGHTVDVRGLWGQLCDADDGGYLMAATAGGQARRGMGGGVAFSGATGLVPGRAYSILQVRQVSKHKLIQLRDHGGGTGWKGAWGRGRPEWARHPDVSMALLGKVQLPGAVLDGGDEEEGTFWIPFDDLVSEFDVFTLAPWPAQAA